MSTLSRLPEKTDEYPQRHESARRAAKTDAYYCEVPNDPCTIVMFGASGDLARRKLLPALYDLAVHGCLAPRFRLVGYSRTEMSDDEFRKRAAEFLPKSGGGRGKADEFLKHLSYFSGDYDDLGAFQRLSKRLDEIDKEGDLHGNRLFYLATPPDVYLKIIEQIGKADLAKPKTEKSWTRVIIEKPFGHDKASACDLNTTGTEGFQRDAGLPNRSLLGQRNGSEHVGVPVRQRNL